MTEPNNRRDQNAESSSVYHRNDDGGILLGSDLGNETVVQLQNQLLKALHEDESLKIFAAEVKYIGAAVVQLFYAAAASARKSNVSFEIIESSNEMLTAFQDLGMDGLIRMGQIR